MRESASVLAPLSIRRRELRDPLVTPRTRLGTQKRGSRPSRPAPLGPPPPPARSGPGGSPLPHDPSPTTGRSRGNLTSDGSRRQRTPSWGSKHPGVAGCREVGPLEPETNYVTGRGRSRDGGGGGPRHFRLPRRAGGASRKPIGHRPPRGTPPSLPDAAAARRRRRHLTTGQASDEVRRPDVSAHTQSGGFQDGDCSPPSSPAWADAPLAWALGFSIPGAWRASSPGSVAAWTLPPASLSPHKGCGGLSPRQWVGVGRTQGAGGSIAQDRTQVMYSRESVLSNI